MKRISNVRLFTTASMILGAALSISILSFKKQNLVNVSASVVSTDGCSYVSKLPTQIDLNAVDNDDVRNYYSSLNSLSASELQGTNLLKNLKPILFEMNYYSYNNIWKIYEITDRDWNMSPADKDAYGGYDISTNSYAKYSYGSTSTPKNDPYVHALYRDSTDPSGLIRAWGSHTNSGINREHVWCQSRGFSDAGNGATGPAGTDLHHLIAGDGYVNTLIHNNNPYGFVDVVGAQGNTSYNARNKNGTALHKSAEDVSTVVFEPADEDKGDIARAIFYMAARYNNYSLEGGISKFEPNLEVANFATSNGEREYSSDTHPVTMGILRDLLVWNKMDPVDEYEIHRNDLIYRNYQGNRNPFVDFPQWADYIWGTATMDDYDPTPTGSANPSSDVLNDANLRLSNSFFTLKTSSEMKISATTIDSSNVTWSVDDTSIVTLSANHSLSGEEITVFSSTEKEGKTRIVCTANIAGIEYSKYIDVTVSNKVVPINPNEEEGFKLDKKTLIIIGIVGGIVAIVLLIVFTSSSKKNQKKMVKTAKKTGKTLTKMLSTRVAKKVSTSSKARKKK